MNDNAITFDFYLAIVPDEQGKYITKIVPLATPISPILNDFLEKAEEVADKHLNND